MPVIPLDMVVRLTLTITLILFSCFVFGQEKTELTTEQKDSIRYTNLKERFYKRKITKGIYKLFFKDIYNRTQSYSEVVSIETNHFERFEGLTIRNITIRQLNMLGASVYDTSRVGNNLQNFISTRLHRNTREKTIRNSMLFFREGDKVDPEKLKDNERILRKGDVLLDARILAVPIPGDPDQIDVLVLVQDTWPIIPDGSFSGFDNFRIGVTNYNVQGWGHTNTISIRWKEADSLQQFGMRAVYTIPYIGRSLISGQFGSIWERDLKHQFVRFSRPFLTVQTVNAGAVEAGIREIREYKKPVGDLDKTIIYPVRYGYVDFWYGRAFRLGSGLHSSHRRLVAAARYYKYHHLERPYVTPDSNRVYWNQRAVLFTFGFSDRNYVRDLLILGFGRTEDVPIGSMATFTLGRDLAEFGSRGYAGVRFSKGGYLPNNNGYLYGLIDAGSYLQKGKGHQGVLNASANYFTPLLPLGLSRVRQFVNLRFTQGFARDALEYINLTGDFGIRGVHSDRLVGKKRLNLGIETILFTPGSFLGFRGAHFVFADFGLIGNGNKLWDSRLYQGYGAGVRLRNEHLTFKTIELRIAYYPNIPALSSDWRFKVSGRTRLKLPDFDMSAPAVVPFY